MKVLNRPMFRMGGPIKEGIMSGIKEPRQRYAEPPGFVVQSDPNKIILNRLLNNQNNAARVFENVGKTIQDNKLRPNNLVSKTSAFDKMIENNQFGNQDPTKIQDKVTIEDKVETYTPPKLEDTPIGKIISDTKKRNVYIDDKGVKRDRVTGEKVIDTDTSKIVTEPRGPAELGITTRGAVKSDVNLEGDNENNNVIDRKEKVNTILEGLGYDRAQKNALYDAMIKAGQRISRTGLGAENLVSDIISDTSQSYDKPEKLREAANLMQVQQDLKIDQIKAQNEYKKNSYEEKEKYLTGILGDADLAKRISVGSPKNVIEAQQIVEKAGINSRSDKGVDATLSIYFDGISGVPKYKGSLSESNTEKLIALKGDRSVAEIKGEAVGDIDDGVYKLGKGYVDIRDGKIFDVREIISSVIEE